MKTELSFFSLDVFRFKSESPKKAIIFTNTLSPSFIWTGGSKYKKISPTHGMVISVHLERWQTPKKMFVFTQSYLKGSFTVSERYVTSRWVPGISNWLFTLSSGKDLRKISLSRSLGVNGPWSASQDVQYIFVLHLVSRGCWLQWSKSKYEETNAFLSELRGQGPTWSRVCPLQLLTPNFFVLKDWGYTFCFLICIFWRNNLCPCRINFVDPFCCIDAAIFKVQKGSVRSYRRNLFRW